MPLDQWTIEYVDRGVRESERELWLFSSEREAKRKKEKRTNERAVLNKLTFVQDEICSFRKN